MNSDKPETQQTPAAPDENMVREENRRLLEQSKLEEQHRLKSRPTTIMSNALLLSFLGAGLLAVVVVILILLVGE